MSDLKRSAEKRMRFSFHPKFDHIIATPEGEESVLVADFFNSEVQGAAYNYDRLIHLLESVKKGTIADADFSGDIHECSIARNGVHIARWEDRAAFVVPLDVILEYAGTLRRMIDERAKKPNKTPQTTRTFGPRV